MPKLLDLISKQSDRKALAELAHKRPSPGRGRGKRGVRQHRGVAKVTIPDFVAFDLETTGLDNRTDRVTELGAVVFERGRMKREFSTLVNPGIPIPPQVIELTGITNDAVAEAPDFATVAADLLAFIGDLPLCGHQVEFDLKFLNSELKRCSRPVAKREMLDTALLSRLVLSGLPGYSLSQVCLFLEVELTRAHRALEDARASGVAACRMLPRLGELPSSVRRTMAWFAPPSLLKNLLCSTVERTRGTPGLRVPDIPRTVARLVPSDEPVRVEPEEVSREFGGSGGLARVLPDYAPRGPQIKMAASVGKAFNSRALLVAEAGAGTGKSLAYLVPAALWSMRNNRRVLVSTHTRNLQDQLVSKDLPMVGEVVEKGFRYSVLKGRSNYLCLLRWHRFVAGEIGDLSARERLGVLPLIKWAEQTETGDVEEQHEFNLRWFRKVWALVNAEAYGCEGKRCRFYNSCYLQQARRQALSSHIVVINHALFFSDMCSGSSFLGDTGTIVFDEAHHLESCGHRFLRVELDTNRVNRYLDRATVTVRVLEKKADTLDRTGLAKDAKKLVRRLRRNATDLLADLSDWAVANRPPEQSRAMDGAYQFAYDDHPFGASGGVAGFGIVLDEMQDMLKGCRELYMEEDEGSDVLTHLRACAKDTSQIKADLGFLVQATTEDHVFWIEGNIRKHWVKLCGVPLDIGGFLSNVWHGVEGSAVFTSATLSVGGSMDYLCHKIGLTDDLADRVMTARFPSPFCGDQMFRCVGDPARVPDSNGYDEYVGEVIASLVNASDRNILVLFTSHAMLARINTILRNRADFPANAVLLAQGVSGTRAALLERLKGSRRTVLLGAQSFWEGVDAPGASCELVVMPRLPFPVPSHPLVQALSARAEAVHGSSFYGFMVPEAVIAFRQGAGRLIRKADDRGALIVLDGRLAGKHYGRVFVESLGGGFEQCADAGEIVRRVCAFFGDG